MEQGALGVASSLSGGREEVRDQYRQRAEHAPYLGGELDSESKEGMTLAAGTKLGSYEILSPLGSGGMGEVYRGRDPKLNREVALKVLPEVFARDAERMARFRREAQVLASLNHPNIATIYGLEESNGHCALVMELVEGPTLAEGIRGSAEVGAVREPPLQLDESLHIAKQIAEGLEYAHERGSSIVT